MMEFEKIVGYKERMAYEHAELVERARRLEKVLSQPGPSEGTTWTTPVDILRAQLHIMQAYQRILEHRAMLEDVKLG